MADVFEWAPDSIDSDYPPRLNVIPADLSLRSDQILDNLALNDTQLLLTGKPRPEFLRLAPTNCTTIQAVVDFVRERHQEQFANMWKAPNIGLRDDWYTDAVFGQQTLSGTDPTAITVASKDWVDQFKTAASQQGLTRYVTLLENKHNNFFVVDYSYLATAMRVEPGHLPTRNEDQRPKAYGGASVTLFRFEPEGKMHPIAIILDFYGSKSKKNVIIFNNRSTAAEPGDEYNDWPWRYAKTVTGVAGWLGHEVGVHLVKAHLVEEVCLVAAHIAFKDHHDHLVFQLIKPHRDVTFAINKAARDVLVPSIIIPAAGFPKEKVLSFLQHTYTNFKWEDSYVPRDLKRRGFSVKKLQDRRYRNCAWARGVSEMWRIVRNFVSTVLQAQYPGGDHGVAEDPLVKAFVKQMREPKKGELDSFPERIDTLDELIDAVTNIIHIATTQHTSINYLQQYYMSFIPNTPGALYTPIPTKLEDLQTVVEADLLAALPITTLPIPEGGKDFRGEWLLQGQVPYLLSFAPPMDKSLLHYAAETAADPNANWVIRSAARTLKEDLDRFVFTVREISEQRDDKEVDYLVLDPYLTTSSIIL